MPPSISSLTPQAERPTSAEPVRPIVLSPKQQHLRLPFRLGALGAILAPISLALPWSTFRLSISWAGGSNNSGSDVMGYLMLPAWTLSFCAIPAFVLGVIIMAKGSFRSPILMGIPLVILGALMAASIGWGVSTVLQASTSSEGGGASVSAAYQPGIGLFVAGVSAAMVLITGLGLTLGWSTKPQIRKRVR